MPNKPLILATLPAALLLAACASGAPAGDSAAPTPDAGTAPRTVLAGVFTAAQADRGEAEFARNCSSCHSPNEFSGPVFQRIWTGRPVGELYETISTMMPQTAPGSLSPQQYTDIITFFLDRNGYPAGSAELPPDEEVLDQVTFQPAD